MSLVTEIERPNSFVFRRAAIQRRSATTGLYDGVWRDISSLVRQWGAIENGVDDVRFNRITHSGINLTVDNDSGSFNHHSNASSLWFGFLNRYRTLVRIQAGYYDTNLTSELPTDPTLGVFVLDSEISIKSTTNDVYLRCASLKSIFDEVRARDILRLFTSTVWTASQIVEVVRDHSDGSGTNVFREFITSTSWTITATTNNYLLTTTVLEEKTTWALMETLAEAEGYVIMITRAGGIEFRPRTARQASSQFSFVGQTFSRPNIIQIDEYKEAWDKYYTYYRLKYLEADTSTSFVTAGTTTVLNASNVSWAYGSRVYEFENRLPQNTASAQAIVDNLFSLSTSVPVDLTQKCLFIPQLDVLDRIDVSYRSYDLANQSLWGVFVWGRDRWAQEGVNFEFSTQAFFVISQKHDLNTFSTTFKLRQI